MGPWAAAAFRRQRPLSRRNGDRKADAHRGRAAPLVPGIRAGYYLCFFGIHVLTPAVMDILGRKLADSPGSP